MVWYGEVLAQLMERYSRIAFNGMRMMTLRNVEMQLRYQELLTEPVEQRVAQALLRLSNDMGQKTKEGILIDVPLARGLGRIQRHHALQRQPHPAPVGRMP